MIVTQEMAQQLRILATLAGDLVKVPSTLVVAQSSLRLQSRGEPANVSFWPCSFFFMCFFLSVYLEVCHFLSYFSQTSNDS